MRGDVIPRRVSLRALDRRQILASAPVRCLSPKSGLTQAAHGGSDFNQACSCWLMARSVLLSHGSNCLLIAHDTPLCKSRLKTEMEFYKVTLSPYIICDMLLKCPAPIEPPAFRKSRFQRRLLISTILLRLRSINRHGAGAGKLLNFANISKSDAVFGFGSREDWSS
jgi:hypothetical protein